MHNRVTLTLGNRVVYWDVEPRIMAILAQNLIQELGPAHGDITDG